MSVSRCLRVSSVGKSSGMDPDLKELLTKQSTMLSHLIDRDNNTQQRLDEHDTLLKNQQSSFLEMSRKVDEMMKQMLPNKQVGAFQGSTELNPKAQLKAVTTRSGRGGDREQSSADDEEPVDEEIEMETPVRAHERRVPASTASNGESPAEKVFEKKIEDKKSHEVDLTRVPYPARLLRQKYAQEYGHFLDMFKQLKINLPFFEALQHMPKYAKFLNDLLSNKKKLEGLSTVCLNEGCSAVVQKKLLEKLADPGHFTIPCLFGSSTESYALADLAVIISSQLADDEKSRLVDVLKAHKQAIAWKLMDIQGISPNFCTHRILMEDEYKPVIQPQRRLNPNNLEVVKKEVIKLLDAGLIYPISDSSWVSPVQVVPKKGGMTVVTNNVTSLFRLEQSQAGGCASTTGGLTTLLGKTIFLFRSSIRC
ncbi:uncharacterized protein LOC143611611 [Bidens hawaiensis]|uniref:uncharacterized protein LOC143611611 n=1 Tax=Bidens hawaiensis TaxID=980011 RepID=UPI00404A678F